MKRHLLHEPYTLPRRILMAVRPRAAREAWIIATSSVGVKEKKHGEEGTGAGTGLFSFGAGGDSGGGFCR